MKYLLILVFLCAFLGAKGQELKELPDRHTNYILVKTQIPLKDAMRIVGRAISKEGYLIESTDELLQSIRTKQAVDGGLIKYNCQVFADFDQMQDGLQVKIYARQDGIDSYTPQWLPIYPGFKKTWEKLEIVAKSIEGAILYGSE